MRVTTSIEVTTAPRAHDPYSASKAHRWMACPGSVNRCKDIPDRSGAAAERGTRIHGLCEAIERGEAIPTDADPDELQIATEFVAKAREVRAQFLDPDDMVVVEAEIDLTHLGIGLPGYVDQLGVGDDVVVVLDFKGGRIQVDAQGNEQGAVYCVGAARQGRKSRAIFVIVQRNDFGETVARVWELDAADLDLWESEIIARRRLAETSDVLVPGEHCMFCPAKSVCEARTSALLVPRPLESFEMHWLKLDAKAQGDILNRVKAAHQLAEEILEGAKAWIQATGVAPEGWQIKAGAVNRFWPDENAVESSLSQAVTELGIPEHNIYKPRALRSPSDIEKLGVIPEGYWKPFVGEKRNQPSLVQVKTKTSKKGKEVAA
jgi:hypothetical protein